MLWKELKKQYGVIIDKAKNKQNLANDWRKFKEISLKLEADPPLAITSLHHSLNLISKKKNRSEIYILDHGCGVGLKAFYLAALGYTNIHGVNVNFDVAFLNYMTKQLFNEKKDNFFLTDGKKVPFDNEYFDFIISSQVVEHLTDDEVYIYYAEEGRVLKDNGLAYHEVPHKFMPYESHSRLWFIHLLPYFCKPLLYSIFISIQKKKNCLSKGKYYAEYFSKKFLILRPPSFHKKMILKNIGRYEDITINRLMKDIEFSSYDKDSPVMLRKLIQRVIMIPFIGKLFVIIFKNFFILQTISKKEL